LAGLPDALLQNGELLKVRLAVPLPIERSDWAL
jgi:hypothetical protein